ncbi:hypothetical protein HELRODRAFT_173107 [Helobdella robusta]|uniref:Reverse transcriptase domain-containing protein n=1 Tax=Helobdella robusta TaxID=6412 RepID=T1F6D1_HELRO|nr:hypothetical protein HELRODRAFT_173107 [Helobdella robusta]ESO04036.1 hypothetical protein HELRODRAFT_173107 [Helobdella robusta]
MLNNDGLGYVFHKEQMISHLLYIDDLKLFAKIDVQLNQELGVVKRFSDAKQMSFGLDKCSKVTLKKGRLVCGIDTKFDDNTEMRNLDQEGVYRYLSVEQSDCIQHSKMKEKIRKEYYRRPSGRSREGLERVSVPPIVRRICFKSVKVIGIKKLVGVILDDHFTINGQHFSKSPPVNEKKFSN